MMGAWHVARFGAVPALALLRERITRLNERNGVTNTATSGYHERRSRTCPERGYGYLD